MKQDPKSDPKSEFKKHVETVVGEPESPAVFAAEFVHELMETAWLSARSVFGERATPEHAIAIYDRMHAVQRDIMGSSHSHDEDDDEGVECNTCGCPENAHVEGGACSHTHCECKKFVSSTATC